MEFNGLRQMAAALNDLMARVAVLEAAERAREEQEKTFSTHNAAPEGRETLRVKRG